MAAANYRNGLRLLLLGSGEATQWLHLAVEADPQFAAAFAALAVAALSDGCPAQARSAIERAAAAARTGSRRERQHTEIVQLLLTGELRRARALAAEHLAEFPTDQLVNHILAGHHHGVAE